MKKVINKYFFALLTVCLNISHSWAVNFKNPTEMLNYVKEFLPESPVILEAGGNLGEDTNRMKSV